MPEEIFLRWICDKIRIRNPNADRLELVILTFRSKVTAQRPYEIVNTEVLFELPLSRMHEPTRHD